MVQGYRKQVSMRTGGIKLYAELKPDFIKQDIKIGRDKFYDFLRLHNLLVPKLKNYVTTTNSNHQFRKYKNLIKDQVPTRPEQLWVSDITYIKTENGHNYLAIVTDAYSKQIMGYKLDNNMKTSLCTEALEMAIKNRKYPNEKLIHHSDRGFQYCNPKYTQFAENNGIIMSMTEQYDPYENAIAERINGILKQEFDIDKYDTNLETKHKLVQNSIEIYNNFRPHLSNYMLTPNQMHKQNTIKRKQYKNKKGSDKKSLPLVY